MNLYEAVLLAGGREVRLGQQVLALPEPVLAARPGLRAFHDRKVILGIRPESLSEASGVTPQDRSVLSADAELVEALGNEILLHFTIEAQRPRSRDAALAMQAEDEISPLAGGSGSARAPGVARMPPRAGVRAGSPVSLRVDTGSLHFFDPDTERAIWE
jgi:multiple sugar transport system ATP-binding protein